MRIPNKALFGLGFSIVFLFSSSLWAGGGKVTFSYEKMEVGGNAEYVLVPDPEKDLKSSNKKALWEKAFELLKEDKTETYGSSTIRVIAAGTEHERVEVRIDSDKMKYRLPIQAEVVYTLTELGADGVVFPQFNKEGLTRADIPFSAFELTVPLWRALPPSRGLSISQVRLPDGTLLDIREVYRRWRRGDAQLREDLYSYLDGNPPYTVRSVLDKLSSLELDYTDQVLPLLERDSTRVVLKTLEVLAPVRNREQVLEAVESRLKSEGKSKVGRRAAQFLGKAESNRYNVYLDFYHLEHGDKKTASRAIENLSDRQPTDRILDRLYAALTDERLKIVTKSIEALESLDADSKQREGLTDENLSDDTKTALARALSEDENRSSRVTGLSYLSRHLENREAVETIRKLGAQRHPEARRALEGLLSVDSKRKRREVASQLAKIGSAKALEPLAESARSADSTRRAMRKAMKKILAKQSVGSVLEQTKSSDDMVERFAYQALKQNGAESGRSDVFDRLQEGLQSKDPTIQAASAEAIGAFETEAALRALKPLADHRSPVVRAGVAKGLAHFGQGQMKQVLLNYLDDSSPEVRGAAVLALAQRGNRSKWDRMVEWAKSSPPEVRANAIRAITMLRPKTDKKVASDIISILGGAMSSDSFEVQMAAIRNLGEFESESAVTAISVKLGAKDRRLRLAAIRALGQTGHPRAVEVLEGSVGAPDPDIRRAVIRALGQLGGAEAKKQLARRLKKEENKKLVRTIEKTLEAM